MSIELKLSDIYKQLKHCTDSISKLGPARRVGSNYENKILEAKSLYVSFKNILSTLPKDVSKELLFLCTCINKCYDKILKFEMESSSSSGQSQNKSATMSVSGEKFNLKTAVSLLPKMTGDEEVTSELMSAIELYDSMLDDGEKATLINFVLKSRLTSGAKMRLATSYTSVELLLEDMRKYLLTRKSDTALQSRLQKATQGEKSVTEFGQEIEKLFVDLTISQANGDDKAYEVLRPLNERNAIRCFSEGLRSQKLGTIISARNMTSLKDAIRVAEDETSSSSDRQAVMSYDRQPTRNNKFTFRGFRSRNSSRYFRGSNHNGRQPHGAHQNSAAPRNTWRGSRGAHVHRRGASSYGARNVRGNRGYCANHSNNRNLNHFIANEQHGLPTSENSRNDLSSVQNLGQFFRS